MTTRTFKNREELIIALVHGEKWRTKGFTMSYDKRANNPFNTIPNSYTSQLVGGLHRFCDGKTLWHKVEEKTELDLMKEKYASGDYICIYKHDVNWVKFEQPLFHREGSYKLIHKKHEKELLAYLADNSVSIEFRDTDGSMEEFEYISNCLKGNFIDSYNEDFKYRLKLKKKTIELAMFSCQRKDNKAWMGSCVHETLEDFKSLYDADVFINHHKIKGSDYEIEVDDE